MRQSPTDSAIRRVSVNKVRQSTIMKGFVQRDCTVIQCHFLTVDRESKKIQFTKKIRPTKAKYSEK